jgi:ABC-type branched-subunit amino acid transport system ATPase component/branched-subunit amino acid ABC-type transport system permease component
MPFVVSGLTVGAIYGLCGTGFVITYKTSGIFNFAYPALAACASYMFWFLHYDTITPGPQWSWPVAAAVSVLVLGPLMGLVMELIARGLATVATELQVLATIGLLLGIVGTLGLFYQNSGALPYDQYLPTNTVKLGGTFVGVDQMILFFFSLAAVIALYAFFRLARMGIAMRAVVDNPPLLDVQGRSPNMVRRWAWVIGATFAAASGVLLGPILAQLNAGAFLIIVIASFGAAAIGAFTSLPLTFLGGLAIGILGDVSQKYVGDVSWLAGLRGALPFIVLFVVLLVTKPSKLAERRVAPPKPIKPSYYAPPRIRVGFAVFFVALLALVPQVFADEINIWLFGLTYMILFLSIGLLVKLSGQVSLCHTALAAIGGAAIGHSTADWGVPWFVGILFAGLITAAVGLIIAVPAIRVSGVFLALATFGFGLFLQQMIYPTKLMFGTSTGIPVPRPSFATDDESFYYLVLAFLVVIALLMVVIHYGRLGRLARAMGDSVLALNTMGTTVKITLVTVFAISAFFAGVAGALYASASTAVYQAAPFYQPFASLQLFAVVLLVVVGTPWYGLAGALSLEIGPYYVAKYFNLDDIAPYLSLLFGVAAVGLALNSDRLPGMPPALRRFWDHFGKVRPASVVSASTLTRPQPQGTGLEVRDLTVRYGGFTAVSSLSVHAPLGRITGLIGPNGAGKTTTFNACSGLVRPASGNVVFNDNDITRLGPGARARRGIGRTFQIPDLWNSLTVAENVALGREASLAGATFTKQLVAAPGEPGLVADETAQALELAGITDIAERLVADLSTGEKRLVELARVLAGPFELLLLDEPSSGLDGSEAHRFGEVLQRAVEARGTGILLVEHDMTFVTQVCDYLYVMDFGQLIFEGDARETMESEVVRTAYLGSEVVTVGASVADGASVTDGLPGAAPSAAGTGPSLS